MARGEIPELAKTPDAGIDRAGKSAHRHLEGIAGVDHQRVGSSDQFVPVGRLDIDADLPRRIGRGVAECHDLLLEPDLQAPERHPFGLREFRLEPVEPAAEPFAIAQRGDQFTDLVRAARECSVDAFGGQQHAAPELEAKAKYAQRLAQLAEVGQCSELIECGELIGQGRGLSGGVGRGKGEHLRCRPSESRDRYTVSWRLEHGASCLCDYAYRWLWAFAGTTAEAMRPPPLPIAA